MSSTVKRYFVPPAIANSGMGGGILIGFVDKKSQTVYSWIDWVVSCNLPFSFPEDEMVVKYASVSPISTETLVKCMGLLTKAVEEIVAAILPKKFGIVFDGSTFRSEHYGTVVAVFAHDDKMEKSLLQWLSWLTTKSWITHPLFTLPSSRPFWASSSAPWPACYISSAITAHQRCCCYLNEGAVCGVCQSSTQLGGSGVQGDLRAAIEQGARFDA
ncbi:unnamed protein product [Phytophthora fragariaefolia]|uniref:Unnamed protein product n=1 Tax=Phytophthora fragariaefolia TaxID=1490495 RepID=A0A9W6YPN6_9STRA|nr:unnamed protein product [Phytophthora fragariaefolia]